MLTTQDPSTIWQKRETTAESVLYACSLTRAIHLEVTQTMETSQFLETLKWFIAQRGRSSRMYSDNDRTFVGAANCDKAVMRDERAEVATSSGNLT